MTIPIAPKVVKASVTFDAVDIAVSDGSWIAKL
jgi:hypothetical protein